MRITLEPEEVLAEVQKISPQVVDLAAERVAGRKKNERIQQLEEALAAQIDAASPEEETS